MDFEQIDNGMTMEEMARLMLSRRVQSVLRNRISETPPKNRPHFAESTKLILTICVADIEFVRDNVIKPQIFNIHIRLCREPKNQPKTMMLLTDSNGDLTPVLAVRRNIYAATQNPPAANIFRSSKYAILSYLTIDF